MVIDMNETQVRTLEQVREVVTGTQALEFRRAEDDVGRYAWIGAVLKRFEYRRLGWRGRFDGSQDGISPVTARGRSLPERIYGSTGAMPRTPNLTWPDSISTTA